jgi:hypothetical protein
MVCTFAGASRVVIGLALSSERPRVGRSSAWTPIVHEPALHRSFRKPSIGFVQVEATYGLEA